MTSGSFDITQRASPLNFNLFRKEFSNFPGGHTDGQHIVADFRSRGYEGTRGNPAIFTNFRPIQHNRANPDQGTVANATAMDNSAVTHGNEIAQ
jgi:hypothetical protein